MKAVVSHKWPEALCQFCKVFDFLSLGSILLAYAVRFFVSHESSVLAFALALPLAYLNTLYYMQGFEESGKLIRMILGIIKGIGSFVVAYSWCAWLASPSRSSSYTGKGLGSTQAPEEVARARETSTTTHMA